jgi:phospholipid transport system substrate-binding protein
MSVFISRRSFAAGAVAGALLVAILGPRAGAADDQAQAFIQDLGDRAIGVLKDKADSSFAEREAAFREVMVAGFDIPTVSRFVLGRHWKTATEQQRADYSAIFVDFIVRVYASRFDSYGGEQFTVHSTIDDESGDKIVRGQIVRPSGGDPIGVDFRVRSRDGSYKVIDVGVEGISMLHTHRVEFGSVINRKGIDGLLSDLRARVEAPVGDEAD